MIPQTVLNVEYKEHPDLTYAITSDGSRISGMVDGLDAVAQAARLRLSTEKGVYPIYSGTYGIALQELIGAPLGFVLPEIERRVREALLADIRILSVTVKDFSVNEGSVSETFSVQTKYGEFESVVTL